MAFLGNAVSSFADLTLLIQIVGFIILLFSVRYAKKRKILNHSKMANNAVILGVLSFIWMGFSFISHIPALNFDFFGTLLIFHSIIGSLALVSGIVFAFNKLIKKTRAPMRSVFLLWGAALFLGVVFYISYYNIVPLL